MAWARLLTRLTGSDALGISVILFVFMAGLGLGSLAFAEPIRRARDPRRAFGLLALLMAGWAALSPQLLSALEPVESLPARCGAAALLLLPCIPFSFTNLLRDYLFCRLRTDSANGFLGI